MLVARFLFVVSCAGQMRRAFRRWRTRYGRYVLAGIWHRGAHAVRYLPNPVRLLFAGFAWRGRKGVHTNRAIAFMLLSRTPILHSVLSCVQITGPERDIVNYCFFSGKHYIAPLEPDENMLDFFQKKRNAYYQYSIQRGGPCWIESRG